MVLGCNCPDCESEENKNYMREPQLFATTPDDNPSAEVSTETLGQDTNNIYYCSVECQIAHKNQGYGYYRCSVESMFTDGRVIRCGEEIA